VRPSRGALIRAAVGWVLLLILKNLHWIVLALGNLLADERCAPVRQPGRSVPDRLWEVHFVKPMGDQCGRGVSLDRTKPLAGLKLRSDCKRSFRRLLDQPGADQQDGQDHHETDEKDGDRRGKIAFS
jgi:hypothetical protein